MNRLKELRQEKKLSQKEIALELQVPPRTYQRWENGESQIKPDKAQALADYFGVPVGYLLGYEETPDSLLDEIASDLNRQLTKDEKEDLKKHPELNEYYLSLAWDRMLKNQNAEVEKQIRAFDDDFINFLKYHDLYLSNTEIEKVINIMYSYSNANNLYLGSLIRDKNLKELRQQKEKDFSELFKYSSLWEMNYKALEKNNTN
ncbi:TPA: helix-turn-helix domain-containing protein [Streptococcus suis]